MPILVNPILLLGCRDSDSLVTGYTHTYSIRVYPMVE